jgi:septal ring factor EnvC (AmiA/AmiB activator)
MKYLGPILAGGLTLIIVVVVGIFSFLPAVQSAPVSVVQPQAATIAPPTLIPVAVNGASAEREVAYQSQIQQLTLAYQQRQAAYQGQIQEIANQINAAQGQLSQLKAQEQALPPQLTQLEAVRAERLKVYQAQLEQVKNQYSDQLAQLQAQLNEAQSKLAQANAQLGR